MSELATLAGAEPAPTVPSPALVYLAGLPSERSRRAMSFALARVAGIVNAETGAAFTLETLPWWRLRYEATNMIRARLIESGASPATVNLHLSALRRTLRAAWRLGLMSAEDLERATDMPNVKGSRVPKGRLVGAGELAALVGACDPAKPVGARDLALLALAFTAGLRTVELLGLGITNYRAEDCSLVVLGKGNKERRVYLEPNANAAVDAWLQVRGSEPGPLLCPVDRSGRVVLEPLTSRGIAKRLEHLAARAKVAPFTPHDARRSFISNLLDSGVDIAVVQQLSGHASPTTTAAYDRRPEEAKRQAVARLHFPYTERRRPAVGRA